MPPKRVGAVRLWRNSSIHGEMALGKQAVLLLNREVDLWKAEVVFTTWELVHNIREVLLSRKSFSEL